MINEKKVKIMTELAMYEQTEGKKYLPISRYFRSDYIGLALIKNFFIVTLGYGLLLTAAGFYFSEFLLNNIHKMNLILAGTYLVAGYVVFLAFYSLVTYIQYSLKYHFAKKSVKKYYESLTKLSKMYGRDESKAAGGSGK